MGKRILRTLWPYVPGTAAVVLLVWGGTVVRRYTGINFDSTSLIILTMIATAWYAGLGPGLLVALLFEGILDYYAYPPRNPVRFAVIAFNRLLLFVSLVVFASARRAAERRLREQQQVLEEALAREREARHEAEAANRVKDDFLATMSHELRTPLNAMVGWAALLTRHQTDPATTRRAAETIERNARAQAHIVEDLLDVSRIAAGGLRIARQPLPPAPIVEDVVNSIRATAAEKAIEIALDLDESLIIVGDRERVRQIVWNLVSNAIKFSQPGGKVDVQLRAVDDQMELLVRDAGIGISAEFLPHLFERFEQADPSVTRERAGLGLGLAIVRHLVELHGGTVHAESAGKDQGAVFIVRMPIAAAAPG